MSMSAFTAPLVSLLQSAMPHVRVRATRIPDVANVRLPLLPWRTAVALAERDTLLQRWMAELPDAFLRTEEGWAKISGHDASAMPWHEGSWVLALRERGDDRLPTMLDPIPGDDGAIAELRRQLAAVVLVVSAPDDIEWTVSADPALVASVSQARPP